MDGTVRAPSVLSSTGQFEVRYNESSSTIGSMLSPQDTPMRQLTGRSEASSVLPSPSPGAHTAGRFTFDNTMHSPSPSSSSASFHAIDATPCDDDEPFSGTAQFTPSPAPSMLSPLPPTRQPNADAVQPITHRSFQQQQPPTTPKPLHQPAAQLQDDDDDDPFLQHSAAAVQLQQQRTLRANSVDISLRGSLAKTVVDENRLRHSPSATTKAYTQATLLNSSPATVANSPLSSLSSAALREKAGQVATLITQFDQQFLQRDSASGEERYPAWAMPFVEEMAVKFDSIVRAQHAAEEQDERDADADPRRSRVRFDASAREERQNERLREAQASRQKLTELERLKALHASARGTATNGFYPDDVYIVGLNDELPFLRDHGNFRNRRSRDSGQPRRPGDARRPTSAKSRAYLASLMGHDMNASMMNRIMRATSRSPTRERARTPVASPGPFKELPGPTIPRAQRFAGQPSSNFLGWGVSDPNAKKRAVDPEKSRRERELELEMMALRLKVDQMMDAMHEREQDDRRDRDRDRDRERDRDRSRRDRDRDRDRERDRDRSRRDRDREDRDRRSSRDGRDGAATAPSGFDENELASALIRIGEANREKFIALVAKITQLQEMMVQQQERMNQMGNSSSHHESDSSAADRERERALAQQLHSQLDQLQRELDQSMRDKERLASQVREMASHQEKNKHALLEKVTDLSMTSADQNRARQQDALLLRTYEEDLRSSRDAILQLQAMVTREADHAKSFRSDKDALQQRLDKLTKILGDKSMLEKDAAYKAGRGSLKPAEKFRNLMNKYLASFYRTEYQNLLAERGKNLAHSERVELEIARAKEKHDLEMTYANRTHEAVLAHVSSSLAAKEGITGDLQEKLENALDRAERLRLEKEAREQDLLATEMLNARLNERLNEHTHTVTEGDFSALMVASFLGDYLRTRNDPKILKAIYNLGDDEVKFSDYVQRIDRRNKYQKRILVITNSHVLCLWADRGQPVRRVISILTIKYVTLSRQSADMLVLHTADGYDYLLITSKRWEIMYHLLALTTKLSGGTKSLLYKFGERVYVRDRDNKHRDIQVAENELILGSRTIRPFNTHDDDREELQQARR